MGFLSISCFELLREGIGALVRGTSMHDARVDDMLLAVASLWLSSRGASRVDGALAIVVALIIAWTGYRILRASIPVLVDERALEAAQIRAAVEKLPGVLEVREIRSRAAGSNSFAEVTIAVRGLASVPEAHRSRMPSRRQSLAASAVER